MMHQEFVGEDPHLRIPKPKLLPLYCLLVATQWSTGLVRDTEVYRLGHKSSKLGKQEGACSWGWWCTQGAWSKLDNKT